LVKGFFLLFFFGISDLLWILLIPWYPVSVTALISGCIWVLDSLNNLKSWRLPFVKAVHITLCVFLSTTIWLFNVCLFFFPE
jgi:type III secretory pathway component EscS